MVHEYFIERQIFSGMYAHYWIIRESQYFSLHYQPDFLTCRYAHQGDIFQSALDKGT